MHASTRSEPACKTARCDRNREQGKLATVERAAIGKTGEQVEGAAPWVLGVGIELIRPSIWRHRRSRLCGWYPPKSMIPETYSGRSPSTSMLWALKSP